MKVVVTVPLEQVTGNPRVLDEGPHDLVHAARQGCAGVGDPVAHGVAETDLDIDPALLAELHQLDGKGDHEPVDVRAGQVLKVAAGDDPGLEDGTHHAEVHLHGLPARHAQLEEDVIVRHRGEDARFLEARFLHEGDVLLDGTDPARDLRVSQVHAAAGLEGLAVALAVEEKLGLADDASLAAEAAHHPVEIGDLLDRVRGACLLAVTEGRVRDEDVLGGAHRDELVIEDDPAHLVVGEDVLLQVGLVDVLHLVAPEFRVLVIEDPLFLIPLGHVASPCTFVGMLAHRPGAARRPGAAAIKKGGNASVLPPLSLPL